MKAREFIIESPQPGHTIDVEFGDLLIETEIVEITEDDGVVVHLDETAMQLILEAKNRRKVVAEGARSGDELNEISRKALKNIWMAATDSENEQDPDADRLTKPGREDLVNRTSLRSQGFMAKPGGKGLHRKYTPDEDKQGVTEGSETSSLNPSILGQMIAKENPSLRDEGDILQAAEHWVRSSRKDLYKDPKRIYITLIEPVADDIVRAFKGALRISEAKYQGRTVQLGKRMKGDVKKFKVYVKNKKGNVIKVNFGQKGVKIKKNNPARRKSFRARHNCSTAKDRTTARYWSCRAW